MKRFILLVIMVPAIGEPVAALAQVKPSASLEGHKNTITCLAFSPRPDATQLLASGSKDGTVRIWDVDSNKLLHVLEGHRDMVVTVAFSPDAKLLAVTSHDTAIKIWDTATGKEVRSLKAHTKDVRGVAFSRDGKTLASGGMDGLVQLWDTTTWEIRKTCKGHTAEINFVTFSKDGKLLASGGWDNTVRLWDGTTGDPRGVLQGHTGMVRDAVFWPNPKFLFSAGKDGMIRVWDVESATQLFLLDGHEGNLVRSVAISPKGTLLISTSRDGTLNMWDWKNGVVINRFQEGVLSFQVATISPDGTLLATGGIDRNVSLIEVITNTRPKGKQQTFAAQKVLVPIEARKQVDKEIVVETTIRASKDRLEKRKEIYLDSEENFKDPKNFAVVINVKGAAQLKEKGIESPADYYKGKTIRARGVVQVVDDIPRILVEKADQITLVKKGS